MKSKTIKILAIDDINDNLIVLKALLTDKIPEAKLFFADSGKNGIEQAKAEHPDVILLDVIMPVMNGFEVCAKLKSDEQLKHIPIIILTAAKTDKESRIKALDIGADAFLAKPIDEAELTAQVKAMLRIKESEDLIREEKKVLTELVQDRTQELEKELAEHKKTEDTLRIAFAKLEKSKEATFNLMEDLKIKIMEHKKAEEELSKSNEFNLSLLQAIPFGMDIVNESGNILFMSKSLKIKLGEDFIDKKCWNLYKDDKTQCSDCPLKIGIDIGETSTLEVDRIFNGRTFQITHTGILFDGQKAILEIFQDITEKKQAEENVKTLSMAVEQSPISIVITNPDGDLEYVNPKFCEVTGYTFEEAIQNNPRILKLDEGQKEEYKKLWDTITSGKTWQGEFHNKKKDGSLYWESASISPIYNHKSKITHFVAVKEDITEKNKMLYDLILAKEKAEKSDKLKSEFLAQMSHEIRTPLNTIINFVELFTSNDGDLSEEDKLDYSRIIKSASNRVMRTIELFINISEINVNTYEAEFNEYDLMNEILPEIIEDKRILADNKNIAYLRTYKTNDCITTADKYSLTQIIENLLDNAIKYTLIGKIECIVDRKTSGELTIEITDTGVGISEEYLPSLFEEFSQEEQGYSRSYDGNGLGLSLVLKYCKINNIEIEVESEKGKGTSMKLTFLDSGK
jgi:PAS domain S-box-containing protein